MKNSSKVVEFKEKLTKEFFRLRKLAVSQVNYDDPVYIDKRREGVLVHNDKTDTIQKFIAYAIAQGASRGAQRYYASIATMENKALFLFEGKFPNMREVQDIKQLMYSSIADKLVERALKEGMDSGLEYKKIYELAKVRVIDFATTVGRSPLALLTKD